MSESFESKDVEDIKKRLSLIEEFLSKKNDSSYEPKFNEITLTF